MIVKTHSQRCYFASNVLFRTFLTLNQINNTLEIVADLQHVIKDTNDF